MSDLRGAITYEFIEDLCIRTYEMQSILASAGKAFSSQGLAYQYIANLCIGAQCSRDALEITDFLSTPEFLTNRRYVTKQNDFKTLKNQLVTVGLEFLVGRPPKTLTNR